MVALYDIPVVKSDGTKIFMIEVNNVFNSRCKWIFRKLFNKKYPRKTNDKILATDLICPKNINNRVEWFKCDITNLNDLNNLYAKTKKKS